VLVLLLAWLWQSTEPAHDRVAAARAALEAHDYGRAAELAAQAATLTPDDGEAWLVLGLAHFRAGRPEPARQAFQRAVELTPSSGLAHFNLGSADFESGHLDEAEREWLQAAQLDGRLAPLAMLRAGMAAEERDQPEQAEAHYNAAQALARAAPNGGPVAADVAERLEALHDRASRRERAAVRALAHAALEDLERGQLASAAARYRQVLERAARSPLSPPDRAEIVYGLGHALLRQGAAASAAEAFAEAARLAPADPDFHFMLGVAEYQRGPEHDGAARAALQQALAAGLSGGQAERARRYLGAIAARAESPRESLTIDARASAGYDSNVPQSGVIVTEPTVGAGVQETDAPSLGADLDVRWRALGAAANGLTLEYRFSQLAYLSRALDPFSLQEQDLTLGVAAAPRPWLALALDLGGFVLFSGVQTWTPFQAGLVFAPRLTLREGAGLETVWRWEHTLKDALEAGFESLAGNRDDIGITERWRGVDTRLALGWSLRREAVGEQRVPLTALSFPQGLPAALRTDRYLIPYSYLANEVSLLASRSVGPWLRASLGARYEHRNYSAPSVILDPATQMRFGARTRVDDRLAVPATASLVLGEHLELELFYELSLARSNIDNSAPATPLDYDNKNFVKQVVELGVVWQY
jgi:tetratricopeptide (TPR) repeat protein